MQTTRSRSSLIVPVLCCAPWGCAAPHAVAQPAYPSKNVQIIVPYTAGGSIDIFSRTVAQRLAEAWPLAPAQLSGLLPREIARYKKAAQEAGIPPQ